MNKGSIISHRCGIGAVACALVLGCAACTEEEVNGRQEQAEKMSFEVGISEEWHAPREGKDAETPRSKGGAFRFEDSDLWVVFSSEAGIDSTLFEQPAPDTRAAAVDENSFYDSFRVDAYVYPSGSVWAESAASAESYIFNATATQGTDGKWTTESRYFWPGEDWGIKFYAYAPVGMNGASIGKNDEGIPVIGYTVPEKVGEQKDLLVADPEGRSGNYKQDVELAFKHILTAVKVRAVGEMEGTITKVALKGVKGTGRYVVGGAGWTVADGEQSYSQGLTVELAGAGSGDEAEDVPVADGEGTFMMLPQELGENAALEVTLEGGEVLTASLAGRVWEEGNTVIYRISHDPAVIEGELEVPTDPIVFSYLGGSGEFSVKSQYKVIEGESFEIVNAPWVATFYDESGEKIDCPAWLPGFQTQGKDGAEAEACSFNVSEQEGTDMPSTEFPGNVELKEAAVVSGVDLSGGLQNTANCYVINAAGTYKFPLVYGNGLKDGKDNKQAYDGKAFVNHLGLKITSPYICRNQDGEGKPLAAKDVCLVWQDWEGLVTDIQLEAAEEGETPYVSFKVDKNTIHQGNAIIAVRDAEERIMWSWHIWVTDIKLDEDIETVQSNGSLENVFLTVDLGACDKVVTQYKERSVKVRITQEKTGDYKEFTIRQDEYLHRFYDQTYYQWGRKDPMLGGDIDKQQSGASIFGDKASYSTQGLQFKIEPITQETKKSISDAILHPNEFYPNMGTAEGASQAGANGIDAGYDWCIHVDGKDKLWNNSTVSGQTVKTIYDPSPIGFTIPLNNVWRGFTKDIYNGNTINGSGVLTWEVGKYFNSRFTSTEDFSAAQGWRFYRHRMPKEGEVDPSGGETYYPACGFRSTLYNQKTYPYTADGKVSSIGGIGYYWSNTAKTDAGGTNETSYCLHFFRSGVTPTTTHPRSNGCAVRPVKER